MSSPAVCMWVFRGGGELTDVFAAAVFSHAHHPHTHPYTRIPLTSNLMDKCPHTRFVALLVVLRMDWLGFGLLHVGQAAGEGIDAGLLFFIAAL